MSIPKGKYCDNKNYKQCKYVELIHPDSDAVECIAFKIKLDYEEYRNQQRLLKCSTCLKATKEK